MPGTNLNLDLPSLSDTMATIVAKLVTALSAVQTDLTPKVTPSQINVNGPLSLAGNALTEVTSLQLAAGNVPQTPGSIFYYLGSFYAIDATGTAIKLTANGLINIGGTGGFVGDYVASNSTGAAYDLASGQFRFTKSAGVWADLAFANLVLQGSAGSVKIGVDAAINTARTVNFKSLPSSGVSGLVYNAATSTIEDAAVTRETNIHKFTDLDVTGNLTVHTDTAIKHPDWSYTLPLWGGYAQTTSGTFAINASSIQLTPLANGSGYWRQHIPMKAGDRVTGLTVNVNKADASQCILALKKNTRNGGAFVESLVGTSAIVTTNSTNLVVNLTVSAPEINVGWTDYFLEVTMGTGGSFGGISYYVLGAAASVDCP